MLGQTLLNRYRIDAQLGQGGMGIVYRGYDVLLDRPVALKVLNATGLAAGGKARLLIEARAAAKLNHPNIVTVYDVGESDDVLFLVMELVPGETPGRANPLDFEATLVLIRQVCAALEHAHAAGVIHRDLKIENILLTPTHTVKLMDFGLARLRESPHLTQDGALIGTFLYMAPELLMGEEASVQSDLYALGVMFYQLICGQPPFKGADPLTLISQHLHVTPVPPSTYNPDIPLGIETLILKLLAKQPDDRPASASEVRVALEPVTQSMIVEPATSVPLDRIVRGRLVGRERELNDAVQLWHKAQLGESEILLISGEPGIGKSRLAREVTVKVQMEHGISLVGECYTGGSAPYAAFAQMILNASDWPANLPPLILADLISLAPGLRVRYPDISPNPALDPQAEQQRLYESVFNFFVRLANQAPLLLVLEDMHWADGGTLVLVRSLARRFRQTHTPVLMVLTFREVELSEQKSLADLLTMWHRDHMAHSLKLHRFDRQGTQDVLEALFAESVTADFADRVYTETEGNPFFIEEMCKALIEGGQVYREDGRWQRRTTTSIEMPRSIRMAIETRLSGLPESTQEVLHLAAVLGRRFEFNALQAAGESAIWQDEDALINALETAEQAQLLYEVGRAGGGTFEFAHALIPATLVESISGMRRRRLHRRAAAALEKLHPEDYTALAHHCLEASEDQRALEFLLKAAQRARAAFAYAEALANYQQALDILHELRSAGAQEDRWQTLEPQLYEDLGDVLELTGQHEQAWASYHSALALVPTNARVWQSRLYHKAGKTREMLRLYDEAAQVYRQAEMALGEEPNEATLEWRQEWMMLLLDRVNLGYWQGRVQEMALLVEKVRPAVERYGASLQRAMFYGNLTIMALRRDRYVVSDEILADAERASVAARETGDEGTLSLAEFVLGFTLLWRGEFEVAEKHLQTAFQWREKTGDLGGQAQCLTYLTVTYRKQGDIEKVRRYATHSQETAVSAQSIAYISMAQANLAWAAYRTGQLAEARALGEAAWETMQSTPQAQMFNWIAVWSLIGISLAQMRIADAVDYARLLLDPKTQPQPETLAVSLKAAIQAWEQEQPEVAHACLIQAAELAEPLGYL
jgi:eukaryotic-like serine/threonine-protein kinase